MDNVIKREIENLLEETTQFDFPFLASVEKKETILNENRTYVEKELKTIAKDLYPSDAVIERVWEEAVGYADGQFKTLPENKRLNGFYLQELMHHYVEALSEIIFHIEKGE